MRSPTSSRPARRCKQAGLEIFGPVILESEAVLISAPDEVEGTETLLRRLRGVMVARRYVLIDYDLPATSSTTAVAVAPGIESPTISPLRDPEWVAVRVMSPRKGVNQVMDALYAIGARAILVTAIHNARLRQMSLVCRVIPCLDVAAGRVVKGVNFENLRDMGDPVELAASTSSRAPTRSRSSTSPRPSTSARRPTTSSAAPPKQVFIPLTVGGGVRTVDDVARLLAVGADKIGVNSAAIARPELIDEIADRFGAQVLVLSLDVKRVAGRPTSPASS